MLTKLYKTRTLYAESTIEAEMGNHLEVITAENKEARLYELKCGFVEQTEKNLREEHYS